MKAKELENLTQELEELTRTYRITFGWQSRLELLERAKKLLMAVQISEGGFSDL